jgi:hypothetical protein
MDATKTVKAIADDADLVFTYFGLFARFEYALKREGYVLADKNDVAHAHWDNYANNLKGRFAGIKDPAFLRAVALFDEHPPQKQILLKPGDSLDWMASKRGDGESTEQFVLRMVRVVRNNLFHGGKFPSGPVWDEARNGALLRTGIVVLNVCLNLDKGLRDVFDGFRDLAMASDVRCASRRRRR